MDAAKEPKLSNGFFKASSRESYIVKKTSWTPQTMEADSSSSGTDFGSTSTTDVIKTSSG